MHAELRESARAAVEALGRYKLRTSLSVLGVVLGVAAVVAMTSVSEGGRREALTQLDALGLDNLIARSTTASALGARRLGLSAADAARSERLVPDVRAAAPLLARFLRLSGGGHAVTVQVLGVTSAYEAILRLTPLHGRFLSAVDTDTLARVCVLGGGLARDLFGYRNPVGERVMIGGDYYKVVGVLTDRERDTNAAATLAWRDVNTAVFVPYTTLSGRTIDVDPGQPADEVWIQVGEGARAETLAVIFRRALADRLPESVFSIVVPRELLAQRQRTLQTFNVIIGSVAAVALLVGGIGIMNIMLTSVLERTREIGIRRTVGATRRQIALQFLTESLMMTLGGGAAGIMTGALVAVSITALAGWATYVSVDAIALGFVVSCGVGLAFGLYPALKAARLEPVDAMRHE